MQQRPHQLHRRQPLLRCHLTRARRAQLGSQHVPFLTADHHVKNSSNDLPTHHLEVEVLSVRTQEIQHLRHLLRTQLQDQVLESSRIYPDLAPASVGMRWRTELGIMGHCCRNSLKATAEGVALGMDLRYVEGYAYSTRFNFALEHAWVEDADGNVFEATWPPGDDCSYLGYAFTLQEATRAYRQANAPLVHGDWERGMPFHESHRDGCRSARPHVY